MAGYKWGTVPKDEKEYQEYLKQSKSRERGGSAAAPQYEQTTTSRNSAYKPGTVPRTQEEYQAYRQYQQAKDQRERQKAAEQQTWDKWKDRFDLKHQREALESAAPTATGNKDADWAGYYANEANYYARYGNKTGYDNSYQKYKDLADKVGAQYDSHLTLHQKTDTTNPAQSFEAQEARYNRDSSLYNRMAQDAAKIGSQEMWDKASSGYGKATSDYIGASVEEQEKANQAYKDWTDELHDNNRGAYFGETLTEDQIDGQIRMLERQKAELEPQVGEAYNAWANPGADETNETVAYSERLFRGRDKRLQEIEDQLAVYQAARRYKDRTKYASLRAQYAPDGRIAPEMAGKVRLGMDRYKADKDNALASANEAAANLENAKHLDYEDEAIFYALYADNPEEAVKWAKMAKEAQDEAWQGEIAEWAGQNTGTRAVALVGGTLARWGSGVANFFAPYSEDVLEMNRFGNALVSGGAQGLTEKGIFNSGFMAGTIDEHTPVVGYVLGGKGLGDLYQLGSSIMESTATAYVAAHSGDLSSVVSALGTIIMGSSASVSDYDECIKRGLTERQALFHALAAGINEAAFEYISLDKLVNPHYGASALKQWFQQAGIEASEEFCTTIANTLAEGYLARRDGYDTSVEQRAKELIAMGMDHDAAVEQAGKEWTTDLINDALGGFISGGFSQGVNAMTGYAMSKFGDVADQIQYDNYMTKALEQQGAMTGANEAQALQSFAAANDIAFDEAAAQGVQSRQPGVTGGIEGSTLAQQAEELAQTKQTRREKRQEKKSNRSLGAVQEQVVSKLADNVRQAGLNNAQRVYEEQVGKHGDGIARSVQAAVARVAAEQFGAVTTDNMAKANAAYKAALEGATSQPVREAIKQGYDMAVEDAAYSGSKAAQSRYLQDKLTGWGKGGALNLNAEIATQDGQTEKVQIADLGNEKGKVVLSNGQTVSVKSLQGLDADVADVIQQADRFDLGTARSLMWRDYQLDAAAGKITDGVRWIMSYAMAFDQGRRGIKTLQEAQAMSSLDEDVVRRAYQQGAEATEEWRRNQIKANEEARSKAPEGVTGKKGILDTSAVSEETMKNLSADKKQALKTIEMLANALGVDFHIIEQAADENGNIKGWQGKYNLGENTIEIDINAGINNIYKDLHTGILAVTGHELTHWMQENAPTEYLAYKRAVLSAIENGKNGHTTLERLIDQVIKDNKKNGLELTRSQAEDEVVADASMKRLGDQEFWDAVSGNLGEQKQGVVAKLKEFFSKFFAKIREIIEKTSHMAEAAQIIDQAEKAVQDTLRKLYAEGIGAAMRGTGGANENAKAPEIQTREKFSMRGPVEATDEEYMELAKDPEKNAARLQEMVDKAAKEAGANTLSNGKPRHYYHGTGKDFSSFSYKKVSFGNRGYGFYFAEKPHLAESYGRPIDTYLLTDNFATAQDQNITSEQVLKIVEKYKLDIDADKGHSTDVKEWIADYGADKKQSSENDIDIILALQLLIIEQTGAQTENILNDFSEVFGYDGIQAGWETVLWNNSLMKRADPVTYDDSGNVIPLSERFNKENEDIRYSTRTTDSAGRQLSEGQQEYFKDSKAVDKDGNLLVLYHGGPGLTVFRGRESSTYSKNAIYMTDEKEVARAYAGTKGKTQKLYANITNPLVLDAQGRNYTDIPLPENAPQSLIDEFWFDGTADLDNLPVYAEANGYDGVIVYNVKEGVGGGPLTEVVVFRSNQIKRTDNLNPTENPDIRYSTRDTSEASDLELMENAAEYLSEAGGEEYWAALLESAPELENQSDEAKRLLKDFQAQAKKLEAARREMTLTQRKLNTTGISGVVKGVMQYFTITDAKKNGIVQKATQALTEGYQEALNAVDKGKSEQVLDITYNAAVKAAEILLTEGRITQNYGGKWSNVSAETRLGEDRQQVIDQMVAAVGADFALNRYRDAIPETAADRLVARTQREMQKKVDAQKEKNAALTAENQKLTRENEWVTAQAKASAEAVTGLNDQLQYLKDKLADSKSMNTKERAKLRQQARNLNNRLQAAKEEAKAWKARAEAEGKLATQYGEKQAALLKKLQAQQEREQKILEGKLKPLAMQRLLRAVREAENKKVTQHKDEVFARYKDNQKASHLRSRIKNLSDEMKRAMTKPTDGSYVPAALYGSMTKLADALDALLAPGTGTKAEARYRAVMDQIHALSAEYRAVQNMDDPVYSSEYDEEIQYQIDELVKTLQGANADEVGTLNMTPAKARELTTEELQKVYNILKYINYCMKTAKDMMSSGQFKSVYDAMRSIADQQQAMRSMNSLGRYGKMKRSRMLDSMNVMRAVEMMSNWDRDAALYQIMHQVEQGVVRSDAWMMDYNKSLQDLKTGKNEKAYREALTKKLDYSVTDKEGLPVKMTKMQAIQILMTAEREAANDKLVHLQKGGAVIRDALKIQDGKAGKASEQYIKVTPELLQRIQASLTEWDKAYMKAIRAYIAKEGKATNQVMYALKHRVLETGPNYVPYIVDKNYLDTKLDEAQAMSMWVKTPGSTNALKQKASQPVIIDGMDTVMAKHVKEIADYIGLALPIRDFSKVYNGKLKQGADENPLPVKETIDRNWAKKGQHLLTQSIIDVQGGSRSQSWSTAIAEHLNGLQSAFVKSALLINPSVTIKQAASYVAAGSILSRAALEMANHPVLLKTDVDTSKAFDPATGLIGHIFLAPNGKTATRIYNEIDKYTSMHYQRRQGMSQYELANEANRSGPVRRMVNAIGANMEQNVFGHAARKVGASLNPVSWIQRMDVATTATLWLACKEQAKMDGLTVNSQEYWQRTTELYERVLRETQPMYDSLHRTAFQKSHGEGLMQYLFPFRTVPIQNHGQLAAAYETLQASKNKSTAEKKAAAKFFRKTVWAQTESAIVFSLMTFIAAALKRKTKKYRDEDEEMGILSVLKGLTQDTAGTLFSVLFPIMGSALWDTGSRLIDKFKGSSGYTYDPFSVGVVDLLNDFAGSFDKIAADVGKMFRGEKAEDFWSHGLNMVLKAAKLAGIPADTIKTYWQGIKGNVEDIANGRVPALNDESWERSAAVNAARYVKALEAGDTEKVDLVEAEMLQDYADAGKNETEAAKALKSKLTSTVKEKYEAGEITAQDARDLLVETGFYEEDDAWYKIDRWDSDLQHKEEDGYSYSRFTKLYDAIDFNQDIKRAVKDLTDHGYTEKDILSKAKTYLAEKFENGAITETQYRNMLARYVGITKKAEADELVAQVKAKARYAEFQRQYPDANVSQSKIDAYYDTIPDGYGKTMKQAGIPMETYITYCEKAATATGTDKDGDGKTDSGSKKAAIMQIINGLNLTRSQKDALYYLNNWSTKTISEAPWH